MGVLAKKSGETRIRSLLILLFEHSLKNKYFQVNVELQQIAAISNHLIPTVASFLKWAPEPKQVGLYTGIIE